MNFLNNAQIFFNGIHFADNHHRFPIPFYFMSFQFMMTVRKWFSVSYCTSFLFANLPEYLNELFPYLRFKAYSWEEEKSTMLLHALLFFHCIFIFSVCNKRSCCSFFRLYSFVCECWSRKYPYAKHSSGFVCIRKWRKKYIHERWEQELLKIAAVLCWDKDEKEKAAPRIRVMWNSRRSQVFSFVVFISYQSLCKTECFPRDICRHQPVLCCMWVFVQWL